MTLWNICFTCLLHKTNLENDKKNLEKEIEENKEKAKKDLELKEKELENKKIIALNEQKDKLNKEKEEAIELKNKEIEKQKEEIERLKRNRNLLGTKKLGNDLEDYCKNQIKNELIDILNDDSVCIPDYGATRNETKADLIVEIKNNKIESCLTIVLEMKTEQDDTEEKNRKSNKSHTEKLIKDAMKKDANIAILVTELEKHDTFLIRKINSQDFVKTSNIEVYWVRPELLIYLISSIRLLFLKYSTIEASNQCGIDNTQLIEEFNKLKNNFVNDFGKLQKDFEKMDNLLKEIEKNADNIKESVDKIQKIKNETINKKIENLNNDLKKLDLKIIQKIKD